MRTVQGWHGFRSWLGMWSKLGVATVSVVPLALLAFFHARGVTSLFGAALVSGRPGPNTLSPPAPGPGASERTARSILERNPFDSSWRAEQARRVPKGPLEAPRCARLALAAVSESDDEAWSLASLVVAAPGQPKLVRRGDRVEEREVVHVGQNPLLQSPAVWLRTNDELCQVVLRERALNGVPPAPSAAGPRPELERAPTPNPMIRRLNEHESEIDRDLLGVVFARQRELASHARPARASDGRPAAQLVRVTPGSLLHQAGFADGDLLLGVDGRDMSTPEGALAALVALRKANRFEVDVERGGRRLTLGFRVR